MSSNPIERRKSPRRQIKLAVAIFFLPQKGLPSWSFGEIRNVSALGAMICGSRLQQAAEDTVIEVLCFPQYIHLPPADGRVCYLITGRVVWQDIVSGTMGVKYI